MKRKNFRKMAEILVLAVCVWLLFGCSHGSSSGEMAENENFEYGSTKVTVFVPDYAKSIKENTRVVATQTNAVKLAYKSGDEFVWLEELDFSCAEKIETEENSQESYVPGSNYVFTFEGIPCGIYAEGEIEIHLLDKNGKTVSKGKNSKEIEILTEETAVASFYAVPVEVEAGDFSLSENEMKFVKIKTEAGYDYEISVILGENDSLYPNLAVFYADGSLKDLVCLENGTLKLDSAETNATYFVGIWTVDFEISSCSVVCKKLENEVDEDENKNCGNLIAKIDFAESDFFCLNCGIHYESQEEAEKCCFEEGCPNFGQPEFVVAGQYKMGVNGGFQKQAANEGFQTVNNIRVSTKIDENFAVLELKSKEQQGFVEFSVEKKMYLTVTEILGSSQKEQYGISIASKDGEASFEGEIVSTEELPKTKTGSTDIAGKKITLTAGTYRLGAHQAGVKAKLSELLFEEFEE